MIALDCQGELNRLLFTFPWAMKFVVVVVVKTSEKTDQVDLPNGRDWTDTDLATVRHAF